MGSKWNESGILRKKQMKDNFDDLLVFGYACKLFRDDERALYIDQGKHLIPWMGDDSLKIDRYDARGALSDLSKCEASREGYNATRWLDLGEADRKLERLCDVERYSSLHKNTDEETIYKEEEQKRKTANEFHFNYNVPNECGDKEPVAVATCEEEDKEFIPPNELEVPADMEIPKTVKVNARIEKTALFVSQQGPQMEILLKAKQSNNPQFGFLNHNDPLQKYYKYLLNAIKSGRYTIRKDSQDVSQQPEMNTVIADMPKESDRHLHPVIILSQPATVMSVVQTQHVPSPPYYTSGACTYTKLVSHIKGSTINTPQTISKDVKPVSSGEQTQTCDQYYHYYQSQYYQYYHQFAQQYASQGKCEVSTVMQNPSLQEQIQRQAVQYAQAACLQYSQSQQHQTQIAIKEQSKIVGTKPTRKLTLVHYSSDSEENSYDEDSGNEDKFTFSIPPDEIAVIVDKMATYVLKNGPDFEDTVKNKGDARFDFLQTSHKYHSYYKFKIAEYAARKKMPLSDGAPSMLPNQESEHTGKTSVCFSIKKHRDDTPKDIKSALPIEESDEEDVANTNEGKVNPEPVKKLVEKEDVSTRAVLTESTSKANNYAKASSAIEVIDLTAGDSFVDASHPKREEDVSASKDWMTSEVHERALQIERKKRATLFLKLKSKSLHRERHTSRIICSENNQSFTIMRSRTVTPPHTDSELEDGEIKSHSSTSSHHRKKSRKRSKRRRNHSETKSSHRKHRKRKVSSCVATSSTSSELD